MTAAVRATVLVIAALAGAIVAVIVGLATWTPSSAFGGEAQDFWREQQARPPIEPRRRPKIQRSEPRPVQHRSVRLVGAPSAYSNTIVLRGAPQGLAPDDDADTFARRATVPAFERAPFEYREPSLPPLVPARPERKPDNSGVRLVCLAAVAAIAIGAGVMSAQISANVL